MELRVKEDKPTEVPVVEDTHSPDSYNETDYDFVTTKQMQGMFDNLQNKIAPPSALTPEVQSVIKAVGTVADLKNALKDPTSAGVEESMRTLTVGLLDRALSNAVGAQQAPQALPKPLLHGLLEIATHNISANLPQVLEGFKAVLGTERIQQGYDAGLKYVEAKQNTDLVGTVMSLDENNDEDINYYAQLMGYTDFSKAKNALIEHKVSLYQEQQEYQDIQQGQNQPYVENSAVQQEYHPVAAELANKPEYQQEYQQEVQQEAVETKPMKIHLNNNKIKLKVADDNVSNDIDNIYDELTV